MEVVFHKVVYRSRKRVCDDGESVCYYKVVRRWEKGRYTAGLPLVANEADWWKIYVITWRRLFLLIMQEKNYTVCFAIFVVLMGLATLMGWRLKMPEMSIPGIELESQHHPDGFENIDIDSKPVCFPLFQPHHVCWRSFIYGKCLLYTQNKWFPQWCGIFSLEEGNSLFPTR